jgi:hypothetical protein
MLAVGGVHAVAVQVAVAAVKQPVPVRSYSNGNIISTC